MELVIPVEEIDKSIIQQVERIAKQLYHDLDSLAGTWSDDDARIFEQAISDFGEIDEALWA